MRRDGCAFCDYAGPNRVLWESGGVFVIEPIDPVTPGHVLVIPREHVDDFATAPYLTADVARVAAAYAKTIGRREDHADFNLITSKGAAATQTVGHLHFHLIPRREGDGLALPWDAPHPRSREMLECATTALLAVAGDVPNARQRAADAYNAIVAEVLPSSAARIELSRCRRCGCLREEHPSVPCTCRPGMDGSGVYHDRDCPAYLGPHDYEPPT